MKHARVGKIVAMDLVDAQPLDGQGLESKTIPGIDRWLRNIRRDGRVVA